MKQKVANVAVRYGPDGSRLYRGLQIGVFTTYGIVNPCDGKFVYVGQTCNFLNRRRSHLRRLVYQKRLATLKGRLTIDHWLQAQGKAAIEPVFVVLETVAT